MLDFFSILYIRPVDANILTNYCVRVVNKRFNNLENWCVKSEGQEL